MSETIRYSTNMLLTHLAELKEGIRSRDKVILEVMDQRDGLRDSEENATHLREHSDLLREVARIVCDEAGLGVIDLKIVPHMVRKLIERNQNQMGMIKRADIETRDLNSKIASLNAAFDILRAECDSLKRTQDAQVRRIEQLKAELAAERRKNESKHESKSDDYWKAYAEGQESIRTALRNVINKGAPV